MTARPVDPSSQPAAAGPRRAGGALQQQLWLKEVEHAQAAAWFAAQAQDARHPAVHRETAQVQPGAARPRAAGLEPPPGRQCQAVVAEQPTSRIQERGSSDRASEPRRAVEDGVNIVRVGLAGSRLRGAEPARAACPVVPVQPLPMPVFELPPRMSETTDKGLLRSEFMASEPPPAQPGIADAGTRVHLHVETHGNGAVAWLGVPSAMLAATAEGSGSVSAWVEQARRALEARGIDVRQVILNGRLAWTVSTSEANGSMYRSPRAVSDEALHRDAPDS